VLDSYDRAMAPSKNGDWAAFGAELAKLQSLLEELSRASGAHEEHVPFSIDESE